MQASVARGPQLPFGLVDVELDEPRPNEVLVKLTASGICHTDLIIRDGWFPTPMPAVLGPEGRGCLPGGRGGGAEGCAGGRRARADFAWHQGLACLGRTP